MRGVNQAGSQASAIRSQDFAMQIELSTIEYQSFLLFLSFLSNFYHKI